MTNDELQAIWARCEAATPGPWDSDQCGAIVCKPQGPRGGGDYLVGHANGGTKGQLDKVANAAFIAAARADVPALFAEVERLRAAIDRIPYTDCELATLRESWRNSAAATTADGRQTVEGRPARTIHPSAANDAPDTGAIVYWRRKRPGA
jgi:hypothetical protein